jgi:hypothetical protein
MRFTNSIFSVWKCHLRFVCRNLSGRSLTLKDQRGVSVESKRDAVYPTDFINPKNYHPFSCSNPVRAGSSFPPSAGGHPFAPLLEVRCRTAETAGRPALNAEGRAGTVISGMPLPAQLKQIGVISRRVFPNAFMCT